MPLGASLDEVLDLVPELAGRRSVAELPGGLTNANHKIVTETGAYVVRRWSDDTGLLAIDRDNEHWNTVRAAETGVGAPVVAYLPEHNAMVLEFIDGRTMSAEELRSGGHVERIAEACRRLHGARRFRDDFDMFQTQPRYLGIVQERGFRLPDRYVEFAPHVAAIRDAFAVREEPAVPCNNDLLAENFLLGADGFRLIDYEYSGNNDPCFELGNVWSESNLSLAQLDELDRRLLRPRAAPQGRARPAVGPDVEVRLDALGLDPGRRLGHRLRLLVVGHGEVRARRGRVRRPRLRAPPRGRPAAGLTMYVVYVALVTLAYYLAGRLGLELAYLDGAVAAVWPPAGVGLAVLFLYGPRMVPGIVIGDLLLADFSTPFGTVLAQTVGNTLARRRGRRGCCAGSRTGGASSTACATCSPSSPARCSTAVISAAFGPTSLWLGDVIAQDELGRVFRTWTLGDMAGVLIVAPAMLTWAAWGTRDLRRRDLAEAAVLLVVLVGLAELPPQRDVPYVVFPALLWAALRFGPRGAATAVLIVCSITVWNTSQDAGPFVRDSVTDSLLATQLFIAIAAVTSLLLAAVTAERTRAARALATAEAAQHELADEQAALRRVATLVAGDAAPSRVFEQVTEEVGRLLGLPGANVMQYDGVRTATVVGSWSEDGQPRFPVGAKLDIDGDTVLARVVRSGEAARVDRYDEATGELAATLVSVGYRGAVAAPVTVGGRMWGVLAAASTSDEPLPEGIEQRLCDFAELVAQALANADAYEKLAASRARLVEVGDAERQRLERNLHDGAQQRLVSVALGLGMVASRLESDPAAARDLLAAAQTDLARGLDELRELARGIHPAMLTERGLGAALDALAARAPVPVEVTAVPEERLAPAVEAAVYYVVAESITNVAKYAHASSATVTHRPLERGGHGARLRRRRRRRRSRGGHGAARARGAGRGPERPARRRQPARRRHAHHCSDPARLTGRLPSGVAEITY